MSLIRDLYSRLMRVLQNRLGDIGPEGIKFCVVGGCGAIVQICGADLLHLTAGVGPLLAESGGIFGGMVLTFFGSRYWTFASKRSHGKDAFKEVRTFLFWALCGWGIQEIIQAASFYGLGLKSGLAYTLVMCFSIGVATIFRFWAYRTFVFTADKSESAPQSAEELEPEPVP